MWYIYNVITFTFKCFFEITLRFLKVTQEVTIWVGDMEKRFEIKISQQTCAMKCVYLQQLQDNLKIH